MKFGFDREWNGEVTKKPVDFRYTTTTAVDREFKLTGVDPFEAFGIIPWGNEVVLRDGGAIVESTLEKPGGSGQLMEGTGGTGMASSSDEGKDKPVANGQIPAGTLSDSDEDSESEGANKKMEVHPELSEGTVVDENSSNTSKDEILTYTHSAFNTNVQCECRAAAIEAYQANERFWEAFKKCAHGNSKDNPKCSCRQFRSRYDKLLKGEIMMPRIKLGSTLVRKAFLLYRKAFNACTWCQEEGFKKPYPKM